MNNVGRHIEGTDYKRNYLALYLSIVRKYSVSKALKELGIKAYKKKKKDKKIDKSGKRYDFEEDEISKMVELKREGKTYKEIAEYFNCLPSTAYNRIKRKLGDKWEEREWK